MRKDREQSLGRGAVDGLAELAQTVDKVTIVAAVAGAAIGIISVGFAVALTTYSVITYFGAEAVKSGKK